MRTGTEPKLWRVSELAALANVTVRTLHHYDAIGLLTPSGRTDAGYRLYAPADVERLHRIRLYRALGFPLDEIARVIDLPAGDRRDALRAQRDALLDRRRRTDAALHAVERALRSLDGGTPMSEDEMFEGMDPLADAPEEVRAHQARYAAEAEERWGGTEAYRESARRARGYRKADWAEMQAEAARQLDRMAGLMRAGADPRGEEAMDGAEALRRHIDRWFYPCSHEMHAGLADMYEADPRFTAYYEGVAPGLAAFVAAAIRGNAARAAR